MTWYRRVGLTGLVLLLTTALAAPPASAATSAKEKDKRKRQQQIGLQIEDLQSHVEDLSAEETALSNQVDTSQARLADLQDRVAALDTQIAAAETDLADAQQRLDDFDASLVSAKARVATLDGEVTAAKEELRRRAVDAYVSQDRDQVTNLVLGFTTQREIDAAYGYASTLVGAQRTAVDNYDSLLDQADRAREAVKSLRDDAAHQRDVVADQASALRAARADEDNTRQQAAAETDRQNQLLDQVQARKADFERQIGQLQTESDSIAALLRSLPASTGGIIVSGKGVFSIPIPGAPIVSGFGPRVHPIFHTVRMHTGIDFAAGTGMPIRAAADGTIVSAGPYGGYGNATIIDHGNGAATLYGHQSQVLVVAGQHVVRGQVIGLVGSTGFSTGPHLHFEVRINGTPVDPVPYL